MTKRITAILLTLMLFITFIPLSSRAQETYTVGNGVEVPSSKIPADGRNPYCDCGLTVGSGRHTCCWNYGYHVYYNIWGQYPNRRDESTNTLRDVTPEERRLTAENLARFLKKSAPGALLRMDREHNVYAGDSAGHTLVFVQMNAAGDGAMFLEGNYNGKGNSRLKEWKFDELVETYGPDSRKDYRYIKYLCWPDAPRYIESYVDLCEKYPTYLTLTATANTSAMTFPCDPDLDAESVPVAQVLPGNTYTATRLLRNSRNEMWFEIDLSGDRAFVPADAMDASTPALTDVSVSDMKAPQRISPGSSFSIKGKITAMHSNLTDVAVYVFQGDSLEGQPITGASVEVNGRSYSLSGSTLDSKTRFGKLSKGEYTYAVFATVEYNYPAADGSLETKEQTVCVYQTRFLVAGSGTDTVAVDFDANGGFTAMDRVTTYSGSALNNLPDACREGYSFRGWSLDGETVIGEGLTFEQDTTLVALWLENGPWNCVHVYMNPVAGVDATCVETGSNAYLLCGSCGSAFKTDGVTATTADAEVIPALGHAFSQADCECDAVCTRCGESGQKATGHEEQEAVAEDHVKPTATEDGSYDAVVYCRRCGKELSRTHHTVPAIVLLGDANQDCEVTISDALLVLRYVSKLLNADQFALELCDMNGDGRVNLMDALAILQTVSGIFPVVRI